MLRRRCREHSGRTPQAAPEDGSPGCHQARAQPARMAARRARPHARRPRTLRAGRGAAPPDPRSRRAAEGGPAAPQPDGKAVAHARLLGRPQTWVRQPACPGEVRCYDGSPLPPKCTIASCANANNSLSPGSNSPPWRRRVTRPFPSRCAKGSTTSHA